MRFAVLLDPVGERLDAPIFHLADGAAAGLDHGFQELGQGFHLLGGHVLAREIHMLIESHARCLSVRSDTLARSPPSPGKARTEINEGGNTGRRAKTLFMLQ